jgi:hypothetical protein
MDNEQTPTTPEATPPAATPVETPAEVQAQPAVTPVTPAPVPPESAPVAQAAPAPVVSPSSPTDTATPAPTTTPAPVIMTSDAPTDTTQADFPEVPKKSRRKKLLVSLLIALITVVVIGGGSAAAYFGVVVPNKPENVLMSSALNTLKQKQSTYDGTFEINPANGSGVAIKAAFNGSTDVASKATDLTLHLTISGVDLTVNARYVDKNLYLKVGDLKTISSLLNGIDPTYGAVVTQLSDTVSNKWIKVDSTLINSSAEASCILNANLTLNDKDIDTIKAQYKAHPFVTITSTSADTLNGKNVQKYVLSINDDKENAFANQLGSLSPVQALKKCNAGKSLTDDAAQAADHDKTPLTVWIDKSTKQIVKLSTTTTAQDAKQDNVTGTATINLDYNKPVHVTAPASSTPAMDLIGQLEAQFGGASSLGSGASFDTSTFDNL